MEPNNLQSGEYINEKTKKAAIDFTCFYVFGKNPFFTAATFD